MQLHGAAVVVSFLGGSITVTLLGVVDTVELSGATTTVPLSTTVTFPPGTSVIVPFELITVVSLFAVFFVIVNAIWPSSCTVLRVAIPPNIGVPSFVPVVVFAGAGG